MPDTKMRDMIMGKSKFGMLTRESVSIITVGKYNRISTTRVLMLENSAAIPAGGKSQCRCSQQQTVMLTTTARTSKTTTLIMLMWSTSTARPTARSIHHRRTTTTARCVWSHLATLGSRWCRVGINDFARHVRPRAWRGTPTRMSYLPNWHQFRVKSVLKWLNCAAVWTVLTWLNCLTNGTELFCIRQPITQAYSSLINYVAGLYIIFLRTVLVLLVVGIFHT